MVAVYTLPIRSIYIMALERKKTKRPVDMFADLEQANKFND